MPATSGIRGTAALAARKYDVADVISLLDVARYPLLAILTNAGKDPVTKQGKAMKKKETTDAEFKWWEDEFGTRKLTASGTWDPDGGNLTITGQSQYVVVGDVILLAAKKWVAVVTAIVNSDTVTLGPELGGATGAAESVAGDAWIIGNANEEGADLRPIKTTTATEKIGYCQIFRTPFGVTETARNTKTFIRENDLDYQRRKKAIEHMVNPNKISAISKFGYIGEGNNFLIPRKDLVSEIELAYLAGLWEGEGSISMYRKKKIKKKQGRGYYSGIDLQTHLTNTDLEIVKKAKDIIERLLNIEMKIIEHRRITQGGRKSYKIFLGGRKRTYPFLKTIEPYFVGEKKRQANLAIYWCEHKKYFSRTENWELQLLQDIRKNKGHQKSVETNTPNLRANSQEDRVQTNLLN